MINETNPMLCAMSRDELEQTALNAAPAAIVHDLRGYMDELSETELYAIVQQSAFMTEDGYLFIKHEGEWTDGDLTFPDEGGMPADDDGLLEGRFVLPGSHLERVGRIMGAIE